MPPPSRHASSRSAFDLATNYRETNPKNGERRLQHVHHIHTDWRFTSPQPCWYRNIVFVNYSGRRFYQSHTDMRFTSPWLHSYKSTSSVQYSGRRFFSIGLTAHVPLTYLMITYRDSAHPSSFHHHALDPSGSDRLGAVLHDSLNWKPPAMHTNTLPHLPPRTQGLTLPEGAKGSKGDTSNPRMIVSQHQNLKYRNKRDPS